MDMKQFTEKLGIRTEWDENVLLWNNTPVAEMIMQETEDGSWFSFKSDLLSMPQEILFENMDLDTARNCVIRKIFEEIEYKKKELLCQLIKYSDWALPNVSAFVNETLSSWRPYLEAKSSFFKESIKFIQLFCNNQEEMIMEERLVKFEVEGKTYEIYGRYDVEKIRGQYSGKVLNYPEFCKDLCMKHNIDGQWDEFNPEGQSWSGHRYNEKDIMCEIIANLTWRNKKYKVLYLDEELLKLVNLYKSHPACFVNEEEVPQYVLAGDLSELYQLQLATDKYIYYTNQCGEDDYLMLDAKTHELVSDNYNAMLAFGESCDAVYKGEERLHYGILPSDVELPDPEVVVPPFVKGYGNRKHGR